jgi:hypothetical protein
VYAIQAPCLIFLRQSLTAASNCPPLFGRPSISKYPFYFASPPTRTSLIKLIITSKELSPIRNYVVKIRYLYCGFYFVKSEERINKVSFEIFKRKTIRRSKTIFLRSHSLKRIFPSLRRVFQRRGSSEVSDTNYSHLNGLSNPPAYSSQDSFHSSQSEPSMGPALFAETRVNS